MATETIPADESRLANFPIMFFAIPMGLFGTTLALHAAEKAYGLAGSYSETALYVSGMALLTIAALYLLKALFAGESVAHEWHHPIRIAFFPAASISLLLMATALSADHPQAALWVWSIGTALQGTLALAVIGSWIGHRSFQTGHLTPAWFIPAVGNVIVPIAGARLGYVEISWLFFSGGLMFWVILLTLVAQRLMFHDPMPGKMVPTLMILVAPPAVAFVAWLNLTGEVGPFGHILLSLGYVFAAVVITQLAKFRRIPFALSWWALSFPIAALTVASFAYAGEAGSAAHKTIGTVLLVVLLTAITGLVARTTLAVLRKEICIAE